MPLYFAYGSNLNCDQMQLRCPASTPAGIARLEGWQFLINTRGSANIIPVETHEVWGVLWRSTPACMATLDVYEGVARRHYARRMLRLLWEGKPVMAITYVGRNRSPGRARRGYLDGRILPAAREWALPPGYLAELDQWMARGMIPPRGRKNPLRA